MSLQEPTVDSQPLKRAADDIASLGLLGFAANETERAGIKQQLDRCGGHARIDGTPASRVAQRAASCIAQSHTLASTRTQRIFVEMRAADEMRVAEATQRIFAEMRVADEMRAAEASQRIFAEMRVADEMRAAKTNRYTAGVIENPPLKLLRSPIEAAKKELLREFTFLLMESVATIVSSPTPENIMPPKPDEATEHRQLPSIAKAESQCRAWLD
jgi:hypothetical protein